MGVTITSTTCTAAGGRRRRLSEDSLEVDFEVTLTSSTNEADVDDVAAFAEDEGESLLGDMVDALTAAMDDGALVENIAASLEEENVIADASAFVQDAETDSTDFEAPSTDDITTTSAEDVVIADDYSFELPIATDDDGLGDDAGSNTDEDDNVLGDDDDVLGDDDAAFTAAPSVLIAAVVGLQLLGQVQG